MKEITYSSYLVQYFRSVLQGSKYLLRSVATAAPYFFGRGDLRKEVTEEYPDPVSSRTEDDLPQSVRGILFNDIEKCTGCLECQTVCPTEAIRVSNEPGPSADKLWVTQFDIDFSRCTFCGLCSEICEPSSLSHTRSFEQSTFELDDLMGKFGRGPVSKEQREKWKYHREREGSVSEW